MTALARERVHHDVAQTKPRSTFVVQFSPRRPPGSLADAPRSDGLGGRRPYDRHEYRVAPRRNLQGPGVTASPARERVPSEQTGTHGWQRRPQCPVERSAKNADRRKNRVPQR